MAGSELARAAARLGLALVCALLGAVLALACVVLHQSWGFLLLGTAACVAVLAALPPAWWSRLPFVAGFALLVLRAVVPRPEGDYLIAADGPGYAVLALTLVLAVAAIVTLPRPARRRRPDPSGPGP